MRSILVSGGSVFVSRALAEYFLRKGDRVYVLNRGRHEQPKGAIWICADRHQLTKELKGIFFDWVLDANAYDREDICALGDALEGYGHYVMISSSAVYGEKEIQPFQEEAACRENRFWKAYGIGKIEAEKELFRRDLAAYSIRPPYIYGEMNNIYREAFVFECAEKKRPFYLPPHKEMKLQFFHIKDLCRVVEALMRQCPKEHIFNVGNEESISVIDWVKLCYEIVQAPFAWKEMPKEIEQRSYFCFHDYEYKLSVQRQKRLLTGTLPLKEGLRRSYAWFQTHRHMVVRREYLSFIDAYIDAQKKGIEGRS